MDRIVLDGSPLTIDAVRAAATGRPAIVIGDDARRRVDAARAALESRAFGDEPIYGVNTGFGSLSRRRIGIDQIADVQRNLVRSHAAGVGQPLPDEIVRSMLLILAASLCRGHSGVRCVLIEQILGLLNSGVTPVVPGRGSVGASGDLAPLSHTALVLIGEGEAFVDGRRVDGAAALQAAGLQPLELAAREGLSLINGTHLMAAMGCAAISRLDRLASAAIGASAMAIDGCLATDAFLDDRLHAARNQPGQQRVAAAVRSALDGSQIVQSHRTDDPRVQDPYCLRAIPQVLGAALDAIDAQRVVIERELGAVTDNPLVFPGQAASETAILSGANFHGMPLAIALDSLAIATCHIAGIAERRVYWVLSSLDTENPVPAHLSPAPGLHSGLMIVQYTAAACCNEMHVLATPASPGNIPTSAGIEDYNSMGATAGHKALAAIDLARTVVAIELLVMAEALEYHRPLRSGDAVERVFALIRRNVPRLTEDRPPAPDIALIERMIDDGTLVT